MLITWCLRLIRSRRFIISLPLTIESNISPLRVWSLCILPSNRIGVNQLIDYDSREKKKKTQTSLETLFDLSFVWWIAYTVSLFSWVNLIFSLLERLHLYWLYHLCFDCTVKEFCNTHLYAKSFCFAFQSKWEQVYEMVMMLMTKL